MTHRRSFMHALWRLRSRHRGEEGFALIEVALAMGIIFVALTSLAFASMIGLVDTQLGKQRQAATAMLDQRMELAQGLTYAQVSKGNEYADITAGISGGDTNIVSCTGVWYYKTCPPTSTAEKIVFTNEAGSTAYDRSPVWPYSSVQTLNGVTYTSRTYVTQAVGVPQAGSLRVTSVVTWTNPSHGSTLGTVTSQILVTQASGTTDPQTNPNPGNTGFYYGTGSISRGHVTVTPNAGVTNGVSGFSTWDSLSQDLYSADANITQGQLTQVAGQATMTGSRYSVSGVETVSGDVDGSSTADDDPATAATTSEASGSLVQPGASSVLSGGGNSLTAGGVSAGSTCPSGRPTGLQFLSGFETGRVLSQMGTTDSYFFSGAGNLSIDSTTTAHGGTYSMKTNPSAGTGYALFYAPAVQYEQVAHFAVRMASALPTSDQSELFAIYNGTANSSAMFLSYKYNSGTPKFQVKIRNNSGTLTSGTASTATIVAGQWYVIDIDYDSLGTTHTVDWQVDGVPQTQVTQAGTANALTYAAWFGSTVTATYTANWDDIVMSGTPADYPIADGTVKILVPNGNSTDNLAGAITDESGSTATRSTWWQKLDELPVTSADYVKENTATTTAYAGFTFADPPAADTCIKAVAPSLITTGSGANKTNTAGFHVIDGATDRTAWNFNLGPNFTSGSINGMGNFIDPTGTDWTNAEVAGLIGRIGYASSVQGGAARYDAINLQYLNVVANSGTPGSESGQTTSVVTATGSPACGSPTQVDSKACSYATESYATTPQPVITTTLDLSGSGAGTCKLYEFTPNTTAGTTSVYARRTTSTVRESVTRYGGAYKFGQLCSSAAGNPTNWPGYFVKYDTGAAADTCYAEAGTATTGPSTTQAGTIYVYDSSQAGGYRSFTPPAAGTWTYSPTTISAFTSGGFKYDITASLSSAPSFTSQVPTSASGTADRSQARAVLGSPITGTITYKVTNASTSAVIADLTITVDLGTLTAFARKA